MSRTSSLRKQHDSLMVLTAEIDEASTQLSGALDAGRLHRMLRQFDTLLKTHLVSEDRLLYPEMLASGDRRTATLASRFCEELGGLTNEYEDFAARWHSPEALQADPAEFRREWAGLHGKLAFRVQRENAELYPLADVLDGSAGRKAS